jgi:hypothetical protein
MTTNKPEFPLAADQITSDDPKPQRARQEQPTRHYRDDAALPYYERHPEWKPRPWRRGQLRPRARRIRESL